MNIFNRFNKSDDRKDSNQPLPDDMKTLFEQFASIPESARKSLTEMIKAFMEKTFQDTTTEGEASAPNPSPEEKPDPIDPAEEVKPEEQQETQATPQPTEETTEDTTDKTKETPSELPSDALLKAIQQTMSAEMNKLRPLLGQPSKEAAEWQQKYEKLYQTVQEDRYRKDKVKLIGCLINDIYLMRDALNHYHTHFPQSTRTEAEQYLEKQIEQLIATMESHLRHEKVGIVPMAKEGDPLKEDGMEVVDTVETTNPALDGKVFRSLSAGYYWTLPYIVRPRVDEKGDEVRSYNFLLQDEKVIIYKYKK